VLQNSAGKRSASETSALFSRPRRLCRDEQGPEILAEYARLAVSRQIVEDYLDSQGRLPVITLDPRIEDRGHQPAEHDNRVIPVLPPQYLSKLVENVNKLVQLMAAQGYPPVFLVSPRVRPYLRKILDKLFKGVAVLSYAEISGETEVKTIGTVENPEAKPAG
jgi:flagellar biosynthesis protein FlhA